MAKRVLITGGAKRIGGHLALALAKAGWDVVINYNHSEKEALSLKEKIERLGRNAQLIQGDLANPSNLASIIDHAGPITALINNASIFEDIEWDEVTIDDWDRHVAVNLTAPFFLSQRFAQNLSGEGRIINFLDWRATRPGKDHLPYTITKGALAAVTKSLAQSLGPRITVNALAFGAILKPSDGGDTSTVLDYVPLGRWADLDEVTESVRFLLEGPSYITGEIIHLDGGRHLV
ncbi:MAG: SDR family oxidoreductase [Sphaerochaeta sp.]